ncbi:malonate transporter subunit MadL [Methylobacterium nigriterrae]|uniref:malonate transporter subunit MadL n=1 Tax=Methylobacterium nigriterrae TaxID=3127512 RepID=UPI00301375EC
MTIFGVALLAICTLVGVYLGDLLGILLGVKANVGGVGLAMILLIAARVWMVRQGKLGHGTKLGVEFWATMYIPIVVAMAAQQNVVAAVSGGPIVIIAATGSLLLCFAFVALLGRFGRRTDGTSPEVEHGGSVIGGDTDGEPAHPAPALPATGR